MNMLSKCCRKEMTVDYGEEGTNCFVCSRCHNYCDIVSDPIAEARGHFWFEYYSVIATIKIKLAVWLQKVVDWLKV